MALAIDEVLNDLAIHETPPSQLLHCTLPSGESGQDSDQPGRSRFGGKMRGPTDPDSVGNPGQVTPVLGGNGVS